MKRWLCLIFMLVSTVASADRVTTFAWDNGTDWPVGTTVELCSNGICASGLTGTQHTLDVPIQPGETINAQVRAVAPSDYQCGNPPVPCPYSAWATLAATLPETPINGWARREEIINMPAPTFVRYHSGSASGTGNLTITLTTPPSVGNLLVVQYVGAINPTSNSAAPVVTENQGNTVTQQTYGQAGYTAGAPYSTQSGIWTIPVTTSSGTHTVTINPAGAATETYVSAVVIEVSGQNASFLDAVQTTTAASSASLAVSLGARAFADDLVLAHTTYLQNGTTITPNGTWTETVEIDQANNTYQALNSIRKTYSATGTDDPTWTMGTGTGGSTGSAIAIKGSSGVAATGLPRRAMDGPMYGSIKGSVR